MSNQSPAVNIYLTIRHIIYIRATNLPEEPRNTIPKWDRLCAKFSFFPTFSSIPCAKIQSTRYKKKIEKRMRTITKIAIIDSG